MGTEQSVKYQHEKIGYHKIMVGYYENMKNNSGSARLTNDEIDEQIAYHTRLVGYHQKRRALIIRGV